MTPLKALEKAIEIVGSQTALASGIGGEVRVGHIYYWLKCGQTPAKHCPAIERETKGLVRCEQLNPDVPWSVLRAQVVPVGREASHG